MPTVGDAPRGIPIFTIKMKKRLLFILCTFIGWLVVFAIQKPLFLLYHNDLAAGHSFTEYLQVILHGLKLDATVSGYLTAIPLLLTIVSIRFTGKTMKSILKVYFAIMSILVAIIFGVDVALYGYWNFRLDSTVFFYLQSPENAMASIPFGMFIVQTIVIIIYAAFIYFLFKRFVTPIMPDTPATKKAGTLVSCILAGGILFIAIRGGLTTSTANVGMVYFSNDQFLNHSAINPCFSLMTSLTKEQDFSKEFSFFTEDKRQELFSALYPTVKSGILAENEMLLNTDRPNILLVILEGISANVVEATGGESDITPNLNRLSEEGILFSNMYANSFRTDRGLVATLNGYLGQPTTSIMKYPSKSQSLPSIALSLREEGYDTEVLYGGDINFTNMRSFFFNSGYNRLTSDKDFPISSRLSKWGANDDITFERLYDDLIKKDENTPWLHTFLTLSSHEPFKVPYDRLEHPYLNSVAFTDSCLGDFVDKIKQTPLWENMLIVFISDHGFRYPESLKEYEPGRYHIPCLWIGGAVKAPMVVDKIVNQTDLASTLLAQMNLANDGFIFSKNIFRPEYPEFAVYTFNNGFGFIDSTGVSIHDNTSNTLLFENPESGSPQRIKNGKAILQTLYEDLDRR